MSIVMKFGGSSVADAAAMRQCAELVRQRLPLSPLVVLSAMGKSTNALFQAAQFAQSADLDSALRELHLVRDHHLKTAEQLIADSTLRRQVDASISSRIEEVELLLRGVALLRELTPRSMDAIAGTGEALSTLLFTGFLNSMNIPAIWVDARACLRTDDHFGSAEPQLPIIRSLASQLIGPELKPGQTVITQGYIGSTETGLSTTLGRGGSDYSASLFGAALGVDEVQIWTDVEGVLTCDPRHVPKAIPIKHLTFAEASELAAFGARVLHPATIQPAVEAGIPVTVRHTHRPDGHFTTITDSVAESRAVSAIAFRGNTTVITVTSMRMLQQSGFLARLFESFARHRVSVDLIATAEVSVSLTVDSETPLNAVIAELSEFATVQLAAQRAIVAIVGERLKCTPGVSARVLSALGTINVEMLSMGASELNLSLVIKEQDVPEALRLLHADLFERN